MSRIGKIPVQIPAGVKVSLKDVMLTVEGPKGKLSRTISPFVKLAISDKDIKVERVGENERRAEAMHGTTRSLIYNMVFGVSQGFTRELEIQGVGFRAQATGNKISFSLGYSHPIEFKLPEGISVKIVDQTKLALSGCDKEKLGLTAAEIRALCPPEPYKGKGVRYAGEVIKKKAGKSAVGGGATSAAKG